jgi:threonine synthase
VSPEEFKGLLDRERRVIDVPAADVKLVKKVIEEHVDVLPSGSNTASV